MKGILGLKVGMTQVFAANGELIPITVIEANPNTILQIKSKKEHGYDALQLGFYKKRENLISKPHQGQFKKINAFPKYFIKEIKNMTGGNFSVGGIVKVDIFSAGEFVDVTGVSKGKGFSGSIKRHNYSRGPMSHGSGYHRGVGSMGPIAPNRVLKSKKMPGHMGMKKVTIQNLEIINVDIERNVLLVKGSVPGSRKKLLIVKKAIKKVNQKDPVKLMDWTINTDK